MFETAGFVSYFPPNVVWKANPTVNWSVWFQSALKHEIMLGLVTHLIYQHGLEGRQIRFTKKNLVENVKC